MIKCHPIVLNLFYQQVKYQLWELNAMSIQINTYKYLVSMSKFHPLEVVGRSSETQLHVGENVNSMT